MTWTDIGRAGYLGYAASTGGKTYDGRDMPDWDTLTDPIRAAWVSAARAILGQRTANGMPTDA